MTSLPLFAVLRALVAGPRPATPAALAAPLAEPAPWPEGLEDAALVDFATCPREKRRRPHAIGSDGAARCFQCGHTTSGRTR
ncbi:hypothetical protein ACPB8P_17480 [Streptomyces cellulosae]